MGFKIVNTDNFNGDYPNESFLNLPIFHKEADAKAMADSINKLFSGTYAPRYWKVVPDDYQLQPGFEP